MTLKRTTYLLLVALLTLAVTACGPEAKKAKAMEGGNKYFDRGQYKQARLMYLNALKADPRFGEAYYKLALTNMRLGGFSEAVGNLQRAVELQPDNLDAHSKLADIFLGAYAANPERNKNLIKEIRDLSAKLEKRAKGSYEDLRLRGYLLLTEGKAAEGLEVFRQADKQKPDQAPLQLTIARTMLTLGQTEQTAEYVRGLLAKDEKNSAAYDLLYGIYFSQKKLDEAEKLLHRRAQVNNKEVREQLRIAAHYAATGRMTEMESTLNGVLTRRADFPKAFIDVGDFYYRLRNYDRAATTYGEGLKQDTIRSRDYQKRLVEVRVAQGRPQEALQLTEQVLKEDPKDPEAIAMRASLWLYAGKPEQISTAITELQSVVSKMPENFVLRYNLGRALMAKGDLDSARVQFLDAMKTRPDYLPARISLAQVLLARREYAAAFGAANEILQIDPRNQYARLIQAQSYIAQNKLPEAKAVLNETLKLYPKQRDVKYQLGFVLFREKNFKEAEAVFQELFSAEPPDMRGLLGLTEVYLATNRAEKALAILDQEMAKFPKSVQLKVAWGNVAINANRIDEAIAMYKTAVAADPKNAYLLMNLGEAYQRKGDLSQAIETWKQASEQIPNNVTPLLKRAVALEASNRRPEAAPLYEQILRQEPNNVIALNNYSYYLADQGTNLDLALTYAQKAKSQDPANASVGDTLGFIYLKKNLPQNAASIFVELTEKHPQVPLFHIRLATAYFQQGQKDKARKALDEARKGKLSDSDKAEIQKLESRLG